MIIAVLFAAITALSDADCTKLWYEREAVEGEIYRLGSCDTPGCRLLRWDLYHRWEKLDRIWYEGRCATRSTPPNKYPTPDDPSWSDPWSWFL